MSDIGCNTDVNQRSPEDPLVAMSGPRTIGLPPRRDEFRLIFRGQKIAETAFSYPLILETIIFYLSVEARP